VCLFVLFVVALEISELERINIAEALFMVYALGFALEKLAAIQEHGLKGECERVLLGDPENTLLMSIRSIH